MPAVSQKQEKFFNFVHAAQKGKASAKGYSKVQEAAKEMAPSSVDHFRSGEHIDKSLPKEAGIMGKALNFYEKGRRRKFDNKMRNWKWMGDKITQVGSGLTGAMSKHEEGRRKDFDHYWGEKKETKTHELHETPAQESVEKAMKKAFENGFMKQAVAAGLSPGQAMDMLKSAFEPIGNAVGNTLEHGAIGGLAGAGIGGLGGYLLGRDKDPEKDHSKRNAMLGALAGGGIGGLGGAYHGANEDYMKAIQPQIAQLEASKGALHKGVPGMFNSVTDFLSGGTFSKTQEAETQRQIDALKNSSLGKALISAYIYGK